MGTVDYGKIFELAHDAILVLDPIDERVLEANRRACALYGFQHEEFVGRSMRQLTAAGAKARNHVRETLAATESYSFETVQVRNDGSEMILEINAAVVDYGGKAAILSINRDATARHRQAAELASHREHLETVVQDRTADLQKAKESLEAKNAELERFAYTVSHGFKGPLVTISGFAGLLEKDLSRGNLDRAQNLLKRIHSAVKTMGKLIDDLLRLTRIGRALDEPEEVPFGELSLEVVDLLSGPITERGVEVEISPRLPAVYGDRLRLRELLQNLVENAVKYLGDQPRPRVEIDVRRDVEETVFFVRDNGKGIDRQNHEKIFGLFERLDAEALEGTGIGLALVKRVVAVHGGRIWVESEGAGHGATFCFTLPVDALRSAA